MKTKLYSGVLVVLLLLVFSVAPLKAQEEEKTSPFSVGADVVSSYVWRGSKQGSGPNIQPSLKYVNGGLTLGSWGSISFHDGGDLAEADLYAAYAFDFGLSLGMTDYYYQGSPYFTYKGDTASTRASPSFFGLLMLLSTGLYFRSWRGKGEVFIPGASISWIGVPETQGARGAGRHAIVIRFLNAAGKEDGIVIRLLSPEQWVAAIKTRLITRAV